MKNGKRWLNFALTNGYRDRSAYMYLPVCAPSLQLCPTLCDPMDYSPPGSSVHGIFPARTLEWVVLSSSRVNLPNPGIKPEPPISPELQANSLPAEPSGKPWAKKKWFKTVFAYFCFSTCIYLYLWPACICRCRFQFLLAHWVITDGSSKPVSGFSLFRSPLLVTQIALF